MRWNGGAISEVPTSSPDGITSTRRAGEAKGEETMSERRFPILMNYSDRHKHPDWPVSIPWLLIAPHEPQAYHNHSQSLKRLAERGGLCPSELYAVLTDQDWRSVDEDWAITKIMAMSGLTRKLP